MCYCGLPSGIRGERGTRERGTTQEGTTRDDEGDDQGGGTRQEWVGNEEHSGLRRRGADHADEVVDGMPPVGAVGRGGEAGAFPPDAAWRLVEWRRMTGGTGTVRSTPVQDHCDSAERRGGEEKRQEVDGGVR